MIKRIQSTDTALDFARSFAEDREFSDPTLRNEVQIRENLLKSIAQPESYRALGVYQGNELLGLFVFLAIPQEKYAEMIVGLSREETAYDEMMEYMKENFQGFRCDFVYNPNNHLLHRLLKKEGAVFDPEQHRMVLRNTTPSHIPESIVPYAPAYWEGYKALHDDSKRYWTAEKTIAHPEKFNVFLALNGNEVIGYVDATYCFDENEIYDLFVRQDMRRRGYGRGLLAKALEANAPRRMMLLVDFDNTPAINLYQSMGFVKDELGSNITTYLGSAEKVEYARKMEYT